jgi:hypothetical protein
LLVLNCRFPTPSTQRGLHVEESNSKHTNIHCAVLVVSYSNDIQIFFVNKKYESFKLVRLTQNSVCVSNQLQLPSTALNITCNQPISGRYVYFMLSEGEFLSLCEVEVWSSACALCPANSVSLPGSVVVGDCQCNPGYTGANGSACIQCPAGFFKNVSGASACQACPAGTYGGGIYCSLCPTGTFSTGTGSTSIKSCTPCKRGTYNEIMGSDSSDMCLSCALGKFHRNLGAGSIDDCKECNCQN